MGRARRSTFDLGAAMTSGPVRIPDLATEDKEALAAAVTEHGAAKDDLSNVLGSALVAALLAAGLAVISTDDLTELYARIDALDDAGIPGALTIIGTPPADATVGEAYNFTPGVLNATGTLMFSLTGALPAGLSFSAATGAITGTPTSPTTATALNITVTDQATGSTDSLDAFFVIVVSPVEDDSRPAVLPSSWAQVHGRDYVALGAISLNHGNSEAAISADPGEYKMGTARYREGGALGGVYTDVGIQGFGYDVAVDGLAHDLLPAEYVIARPLGEVEPIPGLGIRLHTRPSTGPDMTALLDAQFGDVHGAAAAGTDLWCSALLTTFIKSSFKPPAARMTGYRLHFGYADRGFVATQWSTEDGNRAWPNDTQHLPFEYDDQEIIDADQQATSIHAFGVGGATALDDRLGNFPTVTIGVDCWVLTQFLTDRITTWYSLDRHAWTKVAETLVTDIRTGSAVAEYLQRHTSFIHDISAGYPWLGAAGVPLVPLYWDLKETGIWAPPSNNAITVPEVDEGVPEVTLTWRSSYGASMPENIAPGTAVFDLTFPAGVTSANVITYADRLEAVGSEGRIGEAGLDYETQPVIRFAIEGVRDDGATSIGRLYSTNVTDIAEPDWWSATALYDVDYLGSRSRIGGANGSIAQVHDSANVFSTAAAVLLNGSSWVMVLRVSGNPNKDGLVGNASNRFLAFWDGVAKRVSVKAGTPGSEVEAFATILGMSSGSEETIVVISAGTDGLSISAAIAGTPDTSTAQVASIAALKVGSATGWVATESGWTDEKFNAQGGDQETETTAGVRKRQQLFAPASVGGSGNLKLTSAQHRALLATLV